MTTLFGIMLNVLAPVFLLMLIGYLAGPRLQLEARTLARVSYYVLTPAFMFDVLSKARLEAGLAARMVAYSVAVHLGCALAGLLVARLLRRPAEIVAAYVLIAVFGNVGNFGLPVVQFQFPNDSYALTLAGIYFLAILITSFVVGVAAASWRRGHKLRAVVAVLKTPALLAAPPALLVNLLGLDLPPIATRPIGLLAAALIPTMLLGLGVQLAHVGLPRPNADMLLASGLRLIGGALLAFGLAAPFGLGGIEAAVGIVQSSMPTAVLASIIAVEHELVPGFVIATVLCSTLLSFVSLAVVLALVG